MFSFVSLEVTEYINIGSNTYNSLHFIISKTLNLY